jgi:hypothetical protein
MDIWRFALKLFMMFGRVCCHKVGWKNLSMVVFCGTTRGCPWNEIKYEYCRISDYDLVANFKASVGRFVPNIFFIEIYLIMFD